MDQLDNHWNSRQLRRSEAIQKLIESPHNDIYRVVRTRVGNVNCEDVYHDAWQKILEKLQINPSIENFNSWFYKIAHGLAVDFRRKQQYLQQLERTVRRFPQVSQSSIPLIEYQELEVERENRLKQVIVWLNELPPSIRIPYVFHHADECSFRMISDLSGLKEDTIRKRVRRAEEFLRVRKDHFEEG